MQSRTCVITVSLLFAGSIAAQTPFLVKDMTTGAGTASSNPQNLAVAGTKFITGGATVIKTAHVNDLRSNLDAARTALGLSPMSYTDSSMTGGTTIVKATHLNELRTGVK